jgi:dehydrogenase/reductase SDR family member 12
MPDLAYRILDKILDITIFLSYARPGYELRQRWWAPEETEVDLRGRVCVVTGANAGIGKAAALALAQRGAAVHMVARDPVRGEEARAEIAAAAESDWVYLHTADISDLSQVRRLAHDLLASGERLDVLVNNAGAMAPERRLSVDGVELSLATNVVGPFLLTNLLLPRMVNQGGGRVILVSSGGMYTQRLDVEDLQFVHKRYSGPIAYAQNKRAQVILTELWAERLAGSGVTVNAMHPGWVDTPGLRGSLPTFRRVVGRLLRTPEQGADTIVWLAVSAQTAGESGRFWFDRQSRATHLLPGTRATPGERQRLWEACMQLSREV